jgi:hypothetical protein
VLFFSVFAKLPITDSISRPRLLAQTPFPPFLPNPFVVKCLQTFPTQRTHRNPFGINTFRTLFLLTGGIPPLPILELISLPWSLSYSFLSFHALMECPFCKSFLFIFIHLMGGCIPFVLRFCTPDSCFTSLSSSFCTFLHWPKTQAVFFSNTCALFAQKTGGGCGKITFCLPSDALMIESSHHHY